MPHSVLRARTPGRCVASSTSVSPPLLWFVAVGWLVGCSVGCGVPYADSLCILTPEHCFTPSTWVSHFSFLVTGLLVPGVLVRGLLVCFVG